MDLKIKWHNPEGPKLNIRENKGVVYLTAPIFERLPWINHGMSTRIGGVSGGCCAAMNFSYNQFDREERVAENYRIFCEAAGIDVSRVVNTRQVHGNHVETVDAGHLFRDICTPGCDFENTDGLTTDIPGITLIAYGADCPQILLADTGKHAIALCHSGWRGTVGKIGASAVRLMQGNYGTRPEDLLAVISPSICPECFEVEQDVIDRVKEVFSPEVWPKLFYQKNEHKFEFNIWGANRQVLLECGVRPENIFMSNLCTKCNPKLLFSHRAMGEKRGTMISFLTIV